MTKEKYVKESCSSSEINYTEYEYDVLEEVKRALSKLPKKIKKNSVKDLVVEASKSRSDSTRKDVASSRNSMHGKKSFENTKSSKSSRTATYVPQVGSNKNHSKGLSIPNPNQAAPKNTKSPKTSSRDTNVPQNLSNHSNGLSIVNSDQAVLKDTKSSKPSRTGSSQVPPNRSNKINDTSILNKNRSVAKDDKKSSRTSRANEKVTPKRCRNLNHINEKSSKSYYPDHYEFYAKKTDRNKISETRSSESSSERENSSTSLDSPSDRNLVVNNFTSVHVKHKRRQNHAHQSTLKGTIYMNLKQQGFYSYKHGKEDRGYKTDKIQPELTMEDGTYKEHNTKLVSSTKGRARHEQRAKSQSSIGDRGYNEQNKKSRYSTQDRSYKEENKNSQSSTGGRRYNERNGKGQPSTGDRIQRLGDRGYKEQNNKIRYSTEEIRYFDHNVKNQCSTDDRKYKGENIKSQSSAEDRQYIDHNKSQFSEGDREYNEQIIKNQCSLNEIKYNKQNNRTESSTVNSRYNDQLTKSQHSIGQEKQTTNSQRALVQTSSTCTCKCLCSNCRLCVKFVKKNESLNGTESIVSFGNNDSNIQSPLVFQQIVDFSMLMYRTVTGLLVNTFQDQRDESSVINELD